MYLVCTIVTMAIPQDHKCQIFQVNLFDPNEQPDKHIYCPLYILQDMCWLSGLPGVSTNHNEGLALKVHRLLLADLSQDTT